MSLRFVKGQRNKNHLVWDGFRYQMDKKIKEKCYFRCVLVKSSAPCPGKVHLIGEKVVFDNKNHNHAPHVAEIEVKEKMQQIKERSKTTCETPSQIISTIDVSIFLI